MKSRLRRMRKHSFTKEELIKRVEKGDKIGKLMTKVELEYLRGLKNIV